MPETPVPSSDMDLGEALSPKNFATDGDCMFAKGALIGEYEVLSRLGNSGLGELYLVRSSVSRKHFALKVLPPLANSDPSFDQRFEELKGKIQARAHPHMAHVLKLAKYSDVFDYCYLVMEYLESPLGRPETLQSLLSNGSMSETRVLKIALQVCDALDYAHNFKDGPFTHSDLKPSNILFDSANQARVSDFDAVRLPGRRFMKNAVKHCVNRPQDEPEEEKPVRQQQAVSLPKQVSMDMTTAFVLLEAPSDSFRIKGIKKGFGISRFVRSDYVRDFVERFKGGVKKSADKSAEDPNAEKSVRRQAAHGSPTGLNAINSILDTYDYMSPEQKAGIDPTPQSNVYSLGLILYRMLTGRKMSGCWNLPSKFGASKGWDPVIAKCLKMEPEDRYASIAELKAELLKVHARRASAPNLMLAVGIVVATLTLAAAVVWSQWRREAPVFDGGLLKASGKVEDINASAQFPLTLKIRPAGAKVRVFQSGMLFKDSEACPEGGLELKLLKGLCAVEASAPGRPPFRHEFEASPELGSLTLEIPQAGEPRVYPVRTGAPMPAFGFLWTVEDMRLTMIPVSSSPDPLAGIASPFWMADRETSQWAYEKLMRDNPSQFAKDPARPVDRISLDNAIECCKRMTEREKQAERLPEGFVYRLPTEAEWEYCARAGNGGSVVRSDLQKRVSGKDNGGSPAASKPNAWGLFDMQGNLWEFCSDIIKKPSPDDPARAIFEYMAKGGVASKGEELSIGSRLTVKSLEKPELFAGFRMVLAPKREPSIVDETGKPSVKQRR